MAPKTSLISVDRERIGFVRAVLEVTEGVAAASLSDFEGLRVLIEGLADRALPKDGDPLARARLRGAFAQRAILAEAGGALSSAQVAELLGISRQAVDKRRGEGKLLAVELGRRGYLYPAWQFAGGAVVSGLSEVLEALARHDAWAKLRFFVTPDERLRQKRPADLLRKRKLSEVLRVARLFGEHGAL